MAESAPAAVAEVPVAESAPADQPASGAQTLDTDAFALASDALGFSPVGDEVASSPTAASAVPASAHIAPRRRRRRRLAAAAATMGVMGVAGLIAVSMTLPASAVAAVQTSGSSATTSLVAGSASAKNIDEGEIQAYVSSDGAQGESLARADAYSTVSLLDVAAEENIKFTSSLYTNDPNAAIQWPFMVGVAMSSPFGMRNGRMHEGIDLVPGRGATIQAIADGTVRATSSGGAYGVNVYIDHIIDGQLVTSHYAHMENGSLLVHDGEKVKVGQAIGKVGTTGRSTGPHLHFEIIINGQHVDPLAWLRKNAGRYSY